MLLFNQFSCCGVFIIYLFNRDSTQTNNNINYLENFLIISSDVFNNNSSKKSASTRKKPELSVPTQNEKLNHLS